MKIYRISEDMSASCPEEYGYNITLDKRVMPVNWDEPDLQIGGVWTKASVREYLRLSPDAVIYATLADANDLNEVLVEEEDDDVGGYDWSELQRQRSAPPPIVITRKSNDTVVMHDGNHRTRWGKEMGKQYFPAWCYDEKITEWLRNRNTATAPRINTYDRKVKNEN